MAKIVATKECSGCGKLLKFGWNGKRPSTCLPCGTRLKRNKFLLAEFNISIKDYELKLKEQEGVCACCKKQETRQLKGKPASLKVVKDNDTFKLLCLECKNKGKSQNEY